MNNPHEDLEALIRYRFRHPLLLQTALTHRSFCGESHSGNDVKDNERFEFLGDAILGMIIAEWLMEEFPDLREGSLTRLRASLVARSHLAQIARRLRLGEFLVTGKGIGQTKGRERERILADTLEALIAAVYLDGGLDQARRMIRDQFRNKLDELRTRKRSAADPKSTIQELCAVLLKTVPTYQVVEEKGPDHSKNYCVALTLFSTVQSVGRAARKKDAEQEAARMFLQRLSTNPFSLL